MIVSRTSAVLILAASLVLAACASKQPAPVTERVVVPAPPVATVQTPAVVPAPPAAAARESDWRPETYTVKKGDTLYSIALEHGLDYRELAAANNIENPNVIRVGQQLRVKLGGDNGSAGTAVAAASPGVETRPLSSLAPPPVLKGNGEGLKTQPKAVKLPYSEQNYAQVAKASPAPMVPEARIEQRPEPAPATPPLAVAPTAAAVPATPATAAPAAAGSAEVEEDKVDWIWPTTGKTLAPFSETANLKGLDIGGKPGQPVVASAGGRVVYAGSGLRGYGKLIIIKHNKTYLSAYAHNREITIKEGDIVTRGQKIAELGSTDTDQPKLHFEIRRFGKPVDPARYLPVPPSS